MTAAAKNHRHQANAAAHCRTLTSWTSWTSWTGSHATQLQLGGVQTQTTPRRASVTKTSSNAPRTDTSTTHYRGFQPGRSSCLEPGAASRTGAAIDARGAGQSAQEEVAARPSDISLYSVTVRGPNRDKKVQNQKACQNGRDIYESCHPVAHDSRLPVIPPRRRTH